MPKRKTKRLRPAPGQRPRGDHGARAEFRPDDVILERPAAADYPRARVAPHASDCMLDRYFGWKPRPLITGRQYDAGMKLREAWEMASKLPRVVARLDPSIPGAPTDEMPARVSRAKREVERILELLTPHERIVVQDVCRMDFVAGGRMGLLCQGLDKVADGYRLEAEVVEPALG